MSKDTKNTKLWKLLEQRDSSERNEKVFLKTHDYIGIDIKRHDLTDSEIDKLLRD